MTLEELDKLAEVARTAPSHATLAFGYRLVNAYPALRAVVLAAKAMLEADDNDKEWATLESLRTRMAVRETLKARLKEVL